MGNVKPPKFQIQQIALNAPNNQSAIDLLTDLGLVEWTLDTVQAQGYVFGRTGANTADLAFNYQAGDGNDNDASKPLELEVLKYQNGANWLSERPVNVSHLGMHVTNEQLLQYRAYFSSKGIGVAQEVMTNSHTNEAIKDTRRYNYVIFDTYEILGVDLKFIVRLNTDYTPYTAPTTVPDDPEAVPE